MIAVEMKTIEEDAIENRLLDETFLTAKQAVTEIDRETLIQTLSNVYRQTSNDIAYKDSIAIAEAFIEIGKQAQSIEEWHKLYTEKIHIPYDLAPLMVQARKERAENIGEIVAEKFEGSVNKELPILDYGAGVGEPASIVSQRTGRKVFAADVGNFLADGLPETVVFSLIRQGKMLSEIADKSVGDVFLSYALHHANGFDYDTQFEELARVTKEGGILHILETGVGNEKNEQSFTSKDDFLTAQLLDFTTSNFFRDEPFIMPVAGNYHDEEKWIKHAKQAGFTVKEVEHHGRDNFGEYCYDMTFVRS